MLFTSRSTYLEAQEVSSCHPLRKHYHQSAKCQYLKPLPVLFIAILLLIWLVETRLCIFFMLCDPKALFLVLQDYKWQHSEVWTAGVTGKQRLKDRGPEQYLGNTLGMNSHAGLKPPNITSLRLQMFLCLPLFSPSGKWTGLFSSCYKPQGKFPLKTYSEKVPHSTL